MVTAVQDFDFMGGSLGMAAGEAVIAGMEAALKRKQPADHVRRLRRRAHAGRHPVADAAAAHHRRHRSAEGSKACPISWC
jgi:hypothetical protein